MVSANCAIKHTQERLTSHKRCEVAVEGSRLFVGFRTNTMSSQSYISSTILTLLFIGILQIQLSQSYRNHTKSRCSSDQVALQQVTQGVARNSQLVPQPFWRINAGYIFTAAHIFLSQSSFKLLNILQEDHQKTLDGLRLTELAIQANTSNEYQPSQLKTQDQNWAHRPGLYESLFNRNSRQAPKCGADVHPVCSRIQLSWNVSVTHHQVAWAWKFLKLLWAY